MDRCTHELDNDGQQELGDACAGLGLVQERELVLDAPRERFEPCGQHRRTHEAAVDGEDVAEREEHVADGRHGPGFHGDGDGAEHLCQARVLVDGQRGTDG